MFSAQYFERYGQYQPLIEEPVSADTQIFVMIPCIREPAILHTLGSLMLCNLPACSTEVLIIINEPEICDESLTSYNLRTYHDVQEWIRKNDSQKIRFYTTPPVKLPQKWAGVGMARKRGMDEGLWRFNQLDKKNGIIVSLDADTLVDKNYLTAIESHFKSHPGHVGATIAFSHQLEGLGEKQRMGILLYEKYLKYYKNALTFAGYPNALFTIGSAFAVTAEAYLKRGGMTRRKAGEDFYFLQTLTQVGKVGEIIQTEVHPSARVSERVPFGTGPAMKHWMENTADLRYTYNIQAFLDLKLFFNTHKILYKIPSDEYMVLLKKLPHPITTFLESDGFYSRLESLSANCSSLEIFTERFFHLFNAFKVLKFINFSHGKFYEKRLLEEVNEELQQMIQQ
jgi:hypothetical protein